MKQNILILLFAIFSSSCSCLKTNYNSSNSIVLTESNITLLEGKYERFSTQQGNNAGDLYWTFFDRGYNSRGNTEFFELIVINKNKLKVLYVDEYEVIKDKVMKGRIKNGYFEFKRKYLFIPGIFVNLYRDSKFRIRLTKDNNLLADYKQISFGTSYVIIPFYENEKENNMIFMKFYKK